MEGSRMAFYNQIIIHEVKKISASFRNYVGRAGKGWEMKHGRKIGQVQKQ